MVKQEEFVLTLGGQRSNERITRWKTTCNGKKNEKRKRKRNNVPTMTQARCRIRRKTDLLYGGNWYLRGLGSKGSSAMIDNDERLRTNNDKHEETL